MPNFLWLLRMSEASLITALLRRPSFHRFVGAVHKQYTRTRHGIPPEEMGGTNIEEPAKGAGAFFRHFRDEIGNQWRDLGGKRGGSGGNKLK